MTNKVWYIYHLGKNIGQAPERLKAIININHHVRCNILTKSLAYIGKESIRYEGYEARLERIKE